MKAMDLSEKFWVAVAAVITLGLIGGAVLLVYPWAKGKFESLQYAEITALDPEFESLFHFEGLEDPVACLTETPLPIPGWLGFKLLVDMGAGPDEAKESGAIGKFVLRGNELWIAVDFPNGDTVKAHLMCISVDEEGLFLPVWGPPEVEMTGNRLPLGTPGDLPN